MRLTKYLTEATPNLNKDVAQFIKDNEFYKYYKTPEDFQGTCDGVSSDLYKFLLDKGHNVKLIEGVGTKFDLPKDHPNVNIPQFVTHVVLQAGSKVVDLVWHHLHLYSFLVSWIHLCWFASSI